MFGLFNRRKVTFFILIAAMFSISKAADNSKLASADTLNYEAKRIQASAPKGKEEQKKIETMAPLDFIFGILRKSGIDEASKGKYDKAIQEIRIMGQFCEYTDTDKNRIRTYARKIILEMIYNARKLWKKGDSKSALQVYSKAKEAAELGEPRWVGRIDGIVKRLRSSQLAMK
jgi:hypothetical protein